MSDRETLETDLLIVGGGPAGLAAAIHFRRRLAELRRRRPEVRDLSVTVIEKGRAFGAHCISGAAVDARALTTLLPERPLPTFAVPCRDEQLLWLTPRGAVSSPWVPAVLRQHGSVIVSLSRLVRWLAEGAETEGVQLAAGFAGTLPLLEDGRIVGVRTADSGRDRQGRPKASFQAGADVRARLTILAEGARGSVSRQVDDMFHLSAGRPAPVFALGFKELWQVQPGRGMAPGRVLHTLGYPLDARTYGGGFVYGQPEDQIAVGLVVGLDYRDPRLDPYALFQRFKSHPRIGACLEGGHVLGFGARVLNEGGWYSVPRPFGDGFLLVGEATGLLDTLRLKGVHLAMESGMLAAETALAALSSGDVSAPGLRRYAEQLALSPIHTELWRARNFRQAFRWGRGLGLAQAGLQALTGGRGLIDPLRPSRGYAEMRRAVAGTSSGQPPDRSGPEARDSRFVLDRATALGYSGTRHEEDQPTHLIVADPDMCVTRCRQEYDNPCQRFCPAGVYEIATPEDQRQPPRLLIHASNCLHCKTCDIMDPYQIITWVPPEGGGGPSYEAL